MAMEAITSSSIVHLFIKKMVYLVCCLWSKLYCPEATCHTALGVKTTLK